MSGNYKCPFCNSNCYKTAEEDVEEIMKRVEANDAASISLLAHSYHRGLRGVEQDQTRAIELYARAIDLGCSKAHNNLANVHHDGGDWKKAKFHFEAAAMAGNEVARYNVGIIEAKSGNMERAMKHWTIAASAGEYSAMHKLRTFFKKHDVSRISFDSTLAAYNNSCVEMRSKARDACIHVKTKTI
jgi:TPR repeat protein